MSAQLTEVVGRLTGATYALSALGAALLDRTGQQAGPEIRAALTEVLAELGLDQALDDLSAETVRPLLGEIRMALLHGQRRLQPGAFDQGWATADADCLRTAGEVSAAFPRALERLATSLGDLLPRLRSGDARFLDVGVGVATLAIEMVRLWPGLRVVGIDPWTPSLALAREGIQRAGLGDRIELRQQGLQDLTDEGAFDLVWVPSIFIPAAVMRDGLRRAWRALRPGGWLLFATVNPAGEPMAAALARLRTREWGGHPYAPTEAQALLAAAGFSETQVLAAPPGSALRLVAGRR
jgi:SAM-dependent methyltransferase